MKARFQFGKKFKKNLPLDKEKLYFLKTLPLELNIKSLIPFKDLKEMKTADQNLDLLITNDLKRDKEILKKLNSKGLVVLVSNTSLKETLLNITQYDLLIYQSQGSENYFLLKLK